MLLALCRWGRFTVDGLDSLWMLLDLGWDGSVRAAEFMHAAVITCVLQVAVVCMRLGTGEGN